MELTPVRQHSPCPTPKQRVIEVNQAQTNGGWVENKNRSQLTDLFTVGKTYTASIPWEYKTTSI